MYDTVGWGSAVNAEEAAALPPIAGMTLARRQANGVLQDTNSNYQDFYPHDPECAGQEIQEIQPFVTDEFGQTKDAWVEVASYAHGPEGCLLITKAGDVYEIPSVDYAPEGLNVIASGIHASGQTVPLHIGEDSGQVWIAGRSSYADVRLPVSTQGYANIANGQSYAVIDGIWRRTYTPTPGLANVYTIADVSQVDPNACAAVRISEIAPNPIGEDTGSEWLEITNEGDQPAQLWDCVIVVGGSMYYFLPDDVLGPQEWRAVYELHDADQKPKTLSLRNSGTILVALQRLSVHTAPETLQSFEYADAPEGQSWARFADGWRWVLPTPDLDNTMMPLPGSPVVPTEYPADPDMDQEGEDATTKPLAAHISITELLPNPAAPATDDADEFVELFNGSDEPVRLRGYKLQTGNSYK